MEITKTNKQNKTGFTILVYGDSGLGKTTLAKTLPDCLLIDIEGGVASLRKEEVDVVRVSDNLGNLQSVFDSLLTITGYKTVMLDSATELEKAMLIQLANQSRNKGMPSLHDYGVVSFRMRDYVRRLRDLRDEGINVVVTALEMPLELEQCDGIIRTRSYPMMGRKLAPEICGLFDIVAHMEVSAQKGQEGERYLRLQPTKNIVAKNRLGAENQFPAHLGKLIELYTQKGN